MFEGHVALSAGLLALLLVIPSTASAEQLSPGHPGRTVISPEETGSMPRGFHLETRPRYGAIIGGAVTTGIGGLMLATGLAQRAELQRRSNETPADPGSGGEFFIVSGALALAVGLPLLGYGLLFPREVYVRDSAPQLQVGLALDQHRVAAGLTYTF